jgi:hypothetical protein
MSRNILKNTSDALVRFVETNERLLSVDNSTETWQILLIVNTGKP